MPQVPSFTMDVEEENQALAALLAAIRTNDSNECMRVLNEYPLLGVIGGKFTRGILVAAATMGLVSCVSKLLLLGEDVDADYPDGAPALQHAVRGGHEETVSLLLSHGASCSRRDAEGWTALLVALDNRRPAITRLVLNHMGPSEINMPCGSGFTAFWWACKHGYVEEARAMLLAGADHTIASDTGETPRRTAELAGQDGSLMLIEVRISCVQGPYVRVVAIRNACSQCLFTVCHKCIYIYVKLYIVHL